MGANLDLICATYEGLLEENGRNLGDDSFVSATRPCREVVDDHTQVRRRAGRHQRAQAVITKGRW
jgi:hypothetical protein